MKKDVEKQIRIIFLYIFLFSILTWPLIITNQIVGEEDVFQTLWNLNHLKRTISGEENLYFTDKLFYPDGAQLYFHWLSITPNMIVLLLNLLLPTHIAYNYTILILFILSAYSGYSLVKYFTKENRISFLAGLIFSYAPFHFVRAEHHINVFTTFTFPLILLFLFKIKNKPNFKNCLILSFLFLTTFFIDYYYGLMAGFLTATFLIYFIAKKDITSDSIKKILVAGIILILLVTPILFTALNELKDSQYEEKPGHDKYVIDLASVVIPSYEHSIMRKITFNIYKKFTGNPWESSGYIGITVLTLVFYYLIKINKKEKKNKFLLILLIIFFLLSLGSTLHTMGKSAIFPYQTTGQVREFFRTVHFPLNKIELPLPNMILEYTPLINIGRAPNRWIVIAFLPITIFFALGLKNLLSKTKNKTLIYAAIFTLIIIEYISVPILTSSMDPPSFIYDIKNDPNKVSVLYLPCSDYLFGNYNEYWQTIHNKPLIYAALSRKSKEMEQFVHETGIYDFCSLNKILRLNNETLEKSKLKYIIVDFNSYKFSNLTQKEELEEFLNNQYKLLDKDKTYSLYEVSQ